jgi:hypothetical protein
VWAASRPRPCPAQDVLQRDASEPREPENEAYADAPSQLRRIREQRGAYAQSRGERLRPALARPQNAQRASRVRHLLGREVRRPSARGLRLLPGHALGEDRRHRPKLGAAPLAWGASNQIRPLPKI